jgi:hypothetical protein
MTSINAIKFNEYEGALSCDEQRGWNDENMKIFLADKIKSIIPPEMEEKLGIVASYGNTGTSSIGDELRTIIMEDINKKYMELSSKPKKELLKIFTMDKIAELVYETIVNMKHRHIDEELKSKFGFTSADFIRGYYQKDGKKVEINNEEIKKDIFQYLTWDNEGEKARGVFLNSGIMAGYAPNSGFRIYHFDMTSGYYEEVGEIFTAQGSGTMGATPIFTDFITSIGVNERRELDRLEGIFTLIDAINEAKRKNIGVGGYPNIILIDGKKRNEKLREFMDHRSKLASEIVECVRFNYLDKKNALKLLEKIFYKNGEFAKIINEFHSQLNRRDDAIRFLRGYGKKRR